MAEDEPESGTSDDSNVVPFPKRRRKRTAGHAIGKHWVQEGTRNKMQRHRHSATETLIIATARVRRVERTEIEAEMCEALGVAKWEDADQAAAQAWLRDNMVRRD